MMFAYYIINQTNGGNKMNKETKREKREMEEGDVRSKCRYCGYKFIDNHYSASFGICPKCSQSNN